MAGGNAIRGSRVGAGPMGENERGESAPRQRVASSAPTATRSGRRSPSTRACPTPGTARAAASRPAGESDAPPNAPRNEPYKTHLAYVKERRTDEDGEAILDEALAKLRGPPRRGLSRPAWQSAERPPLVAGGRQLPGSCAAASRSSSHSVRCRSARAGRGHLHRGRRPVQRQRDRVGLAGAGGDEPDLVGRVERRRSVNDSRVGGGLGELCTAIDRRRTRRQRRVLGEQRGAVPVRADAEQHDVEARHVAGVARAGARRAGRRRRRRRRRRGRRRSSPSAAGIGGPRWRRDGDLVEQSLRRPARRCGRRSRPARSARRPTTRRTRRQSTASRRRGRGQRAPGPAPRIAAGGRGASARRARPGRASRGAPAVGTRRPRGDVRRPASLGESALRRRAPGSARIGPGLPGRPAAGSCQMCVRVGERSLEPGRSPVTAPSASA